MIKIFIKRKEIKILEKRNYSNQNFDMVNLIYSL